MIDSNSSIILFTRSPYLVVISSSSSLFCISTCKRDIFSVQDFGKIANAQVKSEHMRRLVRDK